MFLDKILKYGKYLPFLNSINNINSMEKTLKKETDINKIQCNYIFQNVFSYVDYLNTLRIVKYNKRCQKKLNLTKETYQFVDIKEKSNNLTENGIKRLLKLKNNNLNDNSNDNKKDNIIVKILEIFSENTELGVDKNCTANISAHINLIPDDGKFLHKYKNLTELTFKYFPNNITTYSDYFQNFINLKILDLSGFVTSNFISMKDMFAKCYKLEFLNLGKINTSKVTDMSGMFEGCINLKIIIGLENFNTSNVINMSKMFAGCHKLETINLRNFNTSKVTNLNSMFYECINLKNLDLNSFNISKVTNMSDMFGKCQYLKNSDFIKNLDFSKKNINTKNMFTYTNFEDLKFEKDYKFSNNIRCNDGSDFNFSLEYRNINEDLDSFTEKSLYNVNFNTNTLDNPDCKLESEDENDFNLNLEDLL